MNNVLQMKEKKKTFTTTILQTEAKQTHQEIVLDSITSSAKSSVFRKQSLSLNSLSKTIQQHSNIQNLTTYLYSTNTIHATSNKPPKVCSKWLMLPNDRLLKV